MATVFNDGIVAVTQGWCPGIYVATTNASNFRIGYYQRQGVQASNFQTMTVYWTPRPFGTPPEYRKSVKTITQVRLFGSFYSAEAGLTGTISLSSDASASAQTINISLPQGYQGTQPVPASPGAIPEQNVLWYGNFQLSPSQGFVITPSIVLTGQGIVLTGIAADFEIEGEAT